MHKHKVKSMQINGGVYIGFCKSIFDITTNRTVHGGQLYPNLVRPACDWSYFQKPMIIHFSQPLVVQFRFLASWDFSLIGSHHIFLLVFDQPMRQFACFFSWSFFDDGPRSEERRVGKECGLWWVRCRSICDGQR